MIMKSFIIILLQILLAISLKSSTALDYEDNLLDIEDPNWNRANWIVSIKTVNNDTHLCDGILIRPNIVMTAAHCLEDYILYKDNLMVLAKPSKSGSYNGILNLTALNYRHKVSDIYIYPGYIPCSRHNNHAILRLSSAFDNDIKITNLPSEEMQFIHKNCVFNLMQATKEMDKKWESGDCGDRAFTAGDLSEPFGPASCEQGNNSPDLIRETHGYLVLCKISEKSDGFYYGGINVYVNLCGPDYFKYKFFDNVSYKLEWINNTLKNIN